MINLFTCCIQSADLSNPVTDRLNRIGWCIIVDIKQEFVQTCDIAHQSPRNYAVTAAAADLNFLLSALLGGPVCFPYEI